MNTKFFGQYLLEKGLINREQLLSALDAQRKSSPLLGDIAIEMGWINSKQAEKINTEQRRLDERFGKIAVNLSLLTDDQIDTLLEAQQSRRKYFGEILIDLGYISSQVVNEQLYEHKQEASNLGEKIDISLKGSGLDKQTRVVCDVFSRFYPRMMKIATSIIDINPTLPIEKTGQLFWAQKIKGNKDYYLIFGIDAEHACYIASKFLKFDMTELNELSIDAVCEFMNTFMGHVYSKLDENTQPEVHPPKHIGDQLNMSLTPCTTIYLDSGQHQMSVSLGVVN
ncbi:hypothetical protein A9Q99_04620 [Gammaproteobacteria bacterium 45_16_T64]|nr:hypothetical protein A9Q99_04620 [Gammaproteobacteria bacterium 45_16_T64]